MENWNKRVGPFSLIFMVAMAWFSLQASVLAANPDDKSDDTMGHGSAEEIVVAKVNGKVINMAQLMREMTEVSRKKHGNQEISPLLAEKIKQEAIDKLIMDELALQSAAATIKTIPPEQVDAKVQAVKKKYKSDEEFQQFIKDEFGGMDGFRRQIERFLILEKFIMQEFDPKIVVNEQEVNKAYDEAKSQYFVTDAFVQVNDLIFFLDPADPESGTKIEKIKKVIIEKYDNDPGKMPNDGSFTVQKNRPLDKVRDALLYEAAKGLKEYGWTGPVNVDGNLHIVQLIGYKPAVNKSLKDVTPYLTNEIRKRKRQELINTWMSGLKEGAKIEIMDLTR